MPDSRESPDISTPDHYGRPRLARILLDALSASGTDVNTLKPDDLAPFENLHIRGRAPTRELATLAGIRSVERVLDLGCGIGGPARTLALEYNCHVTGIDTSDSYVKAGQMLVERLGLTESVSLSTGNALDLPFDNGTFDVVWMQHMGMNVPDKSRLYREARRVLRPCGRIALHEILAGSVAPPHYPTPWADDPSYNHLVDADRLRAALTESGFRETTWRDDTPKSIGWARPTPPDRNADHALSSAFRALLGSNYLERIENVRRNLIEGRIEVIQAVYAAA